MPTARPFVTESFPGSVDGTITSPLRTGTPLDEMLTLPWAIDPEVSWLDYRCWVEIELDAGNVLHRPLPQRDDPDDTLARVFFSEKDFDQDFASNKDGGVVLESHGTFTDYVQRMATSEYRFLLRGYALRVGYQVPIPGIVSIGGQKAVLVGKQRGYNVIVNSGSGGVPVWFATWDSAYVLTKPPNAKQEPIPPNPAYRISAQSPLPEAVLLPRVVPAQNAVSQSAQTEPLSIQGP